jgi:MFS family permease
MNPRERQAWIIAASLFVTLFLVWGGGVNTGPVFLPPLLKYFGWTRARVSTLGSAGALMAGACGPLVGWLVDRIDARRCCSARSPSELVSSPLAAPIRTIPCWPRI